MRSKSLSAVLLASALFGAAACAPRARVVYVSAPPPAPVREVIGAAPGPGYVWVPGHHRWEGHHYEWVRGHWERTRYHRWVEGHWAHNRHGWYWVEGHWA